MIYPGVQRRISRRHHSWRRGADLCPTRRFVRLLIACSRQMSNVEVKAEPAFVRDLAVARELQVRVPHALPWLALIPSLRSGAVGEGARTVVAWYACPVLIAVANTEPCCQAIQLSMFDAPKLPAGSTDRSIAVELISCLIANEKKASPLDAGQSLLQPFLASVFSSGRLCPRTTRRVCSMR